MSSPAGRPSPDMPDPAGEPRPALDELLPGGRVSAAVLVLHGGKATSHERSQRHHLSAVRMRPFAHALHRAMPDSVAVLTLRYRYRGWNAAEASPVADARWALDEIRRRHGDIPIALVGHSMGGRTALRVADDPNVASVVALAPWLPAGEPTGGARGRRILIVHGTADRWTSPGESLAWARRVESSAEVIRRVEVPMAGHFMLRRPQLWTDLTCFWTMTNLGLRTDPQFDPKDLLTPAAGALELTL